MLQNIASNEAMPVEDPEEGNDSDYSGADEATSKLKEHYEQAQRELVEAKVI